MKKKVLDVCCGGRMFYFDKNDPRVMFCDNRYFETTLCDGRSFEVKPDIICDFTKLPFRNNYFHLVVFDPPHLLQSKKSEMQGKEPEGWQKIKYGCLGSDWRDMLAKGFAECFRVLDEDGVLIFKWNETDIPLKEILKLTQVKPIFGHISGKRANTHWLAFIKEVGDE